MFKLFKPSKIYSSVTNIDLLQYYDQGFKFILIDLDNTLTPWNSFDINEDILSWLNDGKTIGYEIFLFSNNNSKRVSEAAKRFKLSYIPFAGKPLTSRYKKALNYMGSQKKNTLMIGDQVFTDILGGNLHGLYTILVNPISDKEFWGTKINRFFERIILKRK